MAKPWMKDMLYGRLNPRRRATLQDELEKGLEQKWDDYAQSKATASTITKSEASEYRQDGDEAQVPEEERTDAVIPEFPRSPVEQLSSKAEGIAPDTKERGGTVESQGLPGGKERMMLNAPVNKASLQYILNRTEDQPEDRPNDAMNRNAREPIDNIGIAGIDPAEEREEAFARHHVPPVEERSTTATAQAEMSKEDIQGAVRDRRNMSADGDSEDDVPLI